MQSSSQEIRQKIRKEIIRNLPQEEEEEGTDKDFDRYAIEVMNGNGYYNSEGKFIRYKGGDD